MKHVININKVTNSFKHLAKISNVKFVHLTWESYRTQNFSGYVYIVQLDTNGCIFNNTKLDNRICHLIKRLQRQTRCQYGEELLISVYAYENGYGDAPILFTEDMAKEGDDFFWKIHRIDGNDAGIGTDVWIKTKLPTENVADLGIPRIYLGTNPEIKYALSIAEQPRLLDDVPEAETGLTPWTMQKVKQWVITYQEPLMAYWRGEIDTLDAIKAICPYKVFIDDDDSDWFE